MSRIDIQQVKIFIAVAEEEQLSRAADKNHISISAASNQIKCLETALETKLFERSNRNLALTESGRILLAHARKLVEDAERLEAAAKIINQKTEGCICIGESTHNSYDKIGDIIHSLSLENPLVKFKLKSKTSSNIAESLKSKEIDIGYVIGDIFDDSLSYHHVDDMQLCFAASPSFTEIVDKGDLASLAKLPWISPIPTASTIYTSILTNIFYSKGIKINAVAFFDSTLLGEHLFKKTDAVMLIEKKRAISLQEEGKAVISKIEIPTIKKHMVILKSRSNEQLISKYLHESFKYTK